jgi:RNA polymerase sigma-70 factor (ECF subfamily)
VPANSNLRGPEKSLEEVIADLQRGRQVAENFRLVFERYHGPVVRMLERNGLSVEDANDLAQEVFLATYCSITELRDGSQFQGWLFSIAKNALRNEIERRTAKKRFGRQVSVARDDPPGTAIAEDVPDRSRGSNALERVLDSERFAALTAALRELPAQMRRCVQLRVIEESTYDEIARAMSVSINTVKAHLHHARKSLREKLRPYFTDVEL